MTTVALALCAGVSAIAGVATGVAVPAGAVDGHRAPTAEAPATVAAPRFLDAGQFAAGHRFGPWTASPVRPGLPDVRTFCLRGTFPVAGTSYATYHSAEGSFGEQFVAVAADDADAEALVVKLRSAIQGCHTYWLDTVGKGIYKHGKIAASWSRYAAYGIADGLRVYGVFTVPPKSAGRAMTHMFAVGREGATVTVVHLGTPGAKERAPVDSFTTTARTALLGLY